MNIKMWNLYKDSENGKKVIELFNPEVEDVFEGIENLFGFAKEWGDEEDPKQVADCYYLFMVNFFKKQIFGEELNRDSFSKFVENFEIKDGHITDDEQVVFSDNPRALIIKRDNYRGKAALTEVLSVFLFYNFEFFKPVLLQSRFDIFQRNCDALGIEIPPIPHTKDYKSFLLYYYDK